MYIERLAILTLTAALIFWASGYQEIASWTTGGFFVLLFMGLYKNA